jgi:hypothetical protein
MRYRHSWFNMWYNYKPTYPALGGSRALTGAGIRVGKLMVGGRAYGILENRARVADSGIHPCSMRNTEPKLNAGLVSPVELFCMVKGQASGAPVWME